MRQEARYFEDVKVEAWGGVPSEAMKVLAFPQREGDVFIRLRGEVKAVSLQERLGIEDAFGSAFKQHTETERRAWFEGSDVKSFELEVHGPWTPVESTGEAGGGPGGGLWWVYSLDPQG